MGQARKPGLAHEPDYVAPSRPGAMHEHRILPGETSIGDAVARGYRRTEAEVQQRRAAAKAILGKPANWDPRDTNLPVERPIAKARTLSSRRLRKR